ncbi:hypothetical protein HN587_02225 [Candidatus Woesearchaeota archaeon]|jgi:hypothetical protein|nr:hypothetical protein [Candidatus Woesearchaeota archaeon]
MNGGNKIDQTNILGVLVEYLKIPKNYSLLERHVKKEGEKFAEFLLGEPEFKDVCAESAKKVMASINEVLDTGVDFVDHLFAESQDYVRISRSFLDLFPLGAQNSLYKFCLDIKRPEIFESYVDSFNKSCVGQLANLARVVEAAIKIGSFDNIPAEIVLESPTLYDYACKFHAKTKSRVILIRDMDLLHLDRAEYFTTHLNAMVVAVDQEQIDYSLIVPNFSNDRRKQAKLAYSNKRLDELYSVDEQ